MQRRERKGFLNSFTKGEISMFKSMKIGSKLSLAFGTLLLIFAGVGATSWMNMSGV